MSDYMKKVKAGDDLNIPAQTFNTFIDAARDYQNRSRNTGQTPRDAFRQAGIVLVKNASGYDCDRFGILGIKEPLITPTDNADEFKNRIALDARTPYATPYWGKFVILLEPLANGAIGSACAAGISQAKIDVQDEDDLFADVKDSDRAKLQSYPTGSARILWKETGTGEKWAIVKLGLCPFPKIPDITKSYVIAYDKDTGLLEWKEVTFVCPNP